MNLGQEVLKLASGWLRRCSSLFLSGLLEYIPNIKCWEDVLTVKTIRRLSSYHSTCNS